MSSLEHRKIGRRKGEPETSLMDFPQHEDDSFANSPSPPYSNNKSERKKSSPYSANRSREESSLTHNKLTEYMTCVICFQLVTDNRECVQCHSVACVSCLNQFHSNKDKSIHRPCPACNLPTADENGKPLMPISGEEKGNHSVFVDKRGAGDNEKDLIDSFLGNVSGPQQTRLSHNNLLQKMVNRMPSRCSFCQTSCTHGHLTDHYPNCPAHVTYGDYYRLGRSFDTQHVELLEMEKEIIQLRRLCETKSSRSLS